MAEQFKLQQRKRPVQPLAYRAREAAAALGISERSLFELAKRGEIRTFQLGKGKRAARLFPVAELEAWLARRLEVGAS